MLKWDGTVRHILFSLFAHAAAAGHLVNENSQLQQDSVKGLIEHLSDSGSLTEYKTSNWTKF